MMNKFNLSIFSCSIQLKVMTLGHRSMLFHGTTLLICSQLLVQRGKTHDEFLIEGAPKTTLMLYNEIL